MQPKEFLASLAKGRESILATMEILTDRDLTDRLLHLSKTIDDDVAAGRLLTTADVRGALWRSSRVCGIAAWRRKAASTADRPAPLRGPRCGITGSTSLEIIASPSGPSLVTRHCP
jgi:hypothetical protein